MNTTGTVYAPVQLEEITPKYRSGMFWLVVNVLLTLASIGLMIWGCIIIADATAPGVAMLVVSALYICTACPILFAGLKVVKPNEALVLTLFGKYSGTLRRDGFYFVNPFSVAAPSPIPSTSDKAVAAEQAAIKQKNGEASIRVSLPSRRISLKTMTLNNEKQKINDKMGNPIIIGIVVIWRVENTAKALFNVDNYVDFLSTQCDSALRNIVRMYPYDANSDDDDHTEKSLRGSSAEIADKLREEIASKVEDVAGLKILEARITHLAYAPEIAAAMLQRQQASAIVDARQLIVEGAVGMVEMALDRLSEHEIVHLDEERKAAMVSNLLVVLCGNHDAQPIVNSGSLY